MERRGPVYANNPCTEVGFKRPPVFMTIAVFPPSALATIAARSRLPVASSRTCMTDKGSTGICRPLTMIRST